MTELGGPERFRGLVNHYASKYSETDLGAETASVATQVGRTLDEVLLGNLYYDTLKCAFGCTAFAVDSPDGPIHARNLDWWADGGILSRYTLLSRFHQSGEERFVTVGWPGYIGALSGMAPGRFAVTLNSVFGLDQPAAGTPVSFLIREVLEKAGDFDEAVERLSSEELCCDCLLLVTGARQGEIAVIERTPKRHAVRGAEEDVAVVTNNYRLLDWDASAAAGSLALSSCDRYDRANEMLSDRRPANGVECFRILGDPNVQMTITMQQMAFHAATGQVEVRLPDLDAGLFPPSE